MVYRNGYISVKDLGKNNFKMCYCRQRQTFEKTIKGHDLYTALIIFKKEINNQGY